MKDQQAVLNNKKQVSQRKSTVGMMTSMPTARMGRMRHKQDEDRTN